MNVRGALVLAIACAAVAPLAAAPRPHTLADLAWFEGTWRAVTVSASGERTEQEEHWGAAIGETRLGWFRMLRGGRARFYEFQAQRADSAGVRLQIKHFGREMDGWEAPDSSTTYTLEHVGDHEARFACPGDDFPVMTYRVRDDTLAIRLEGTDRASGRPAAMEFRLARVRDAGPGPRKPEHPE